MHVYAGDYHLNFCTHYIMMIKTDLFNTIPGATGLSVIPRTCPLLIVLVLLSESILHSRNMISTISHGIRVLSCEPLSSVSIVELTFSGLALYPQL